MCSPSIAPILNPFKTLAKVTGVPFFDPLGGLAKITGVPFFDPVGTVTGAITGGGSNGSSGSVSTVGGSSAPSQSPGVIDVYAPAAGGGTSVMPSANAYAVNSGPSLNTYARGSQQSGVTTVGGEDELGPFKKGGRKAVRKVEL